MSRVNKTMDKKEWKKSVDGLLRMCQQFSYKGSDYELNDIILTGYNLRTHNECDLKG